MEKKRKKNQILQGELLMTTTPPKTQRRQTELKFQPMSPTPTPTQHKQPLQRLQMTHHQPPTQQHISPTQPMHIHRFHPATQQTSAPTTTTTTTTTTNSHQQPSTTTFTHYTPKVPQKIFAPIQPQPQQQQQQPPQQQHHQQHQQQQHHQHQQHQHQHQQQHQQHQQHQHQQHQQTMYERQQQMNQPRMQGIQQQTSSSPVTSPSQARYTGNMRTYNNNNNNNNNYTNNGTSTTYTVYNNQLSYVQPRLQYYKIETTKNNTDSYQGKELFKITRKKDKYFEETKSDEIVQYTTQSGGVHIFGHGVDNLHDYSISLFKYIESIPKTDKKIKVQFYNRIYAHSQGKKTQKLFIQKLDPQELIRELDGLIKREQQGIFEFKNSKSNIKTYNMIETTKENAINYHYCGLNEPIYVQHFPSSSKVTK